MKGTMVTKEFLDELYNKYKELHPLYVPEELRQGQPKEISRQIRNDAKVYAWDCLNVIVSTEKENER